MVDVLNEEKELEDDANAVLGASDDKNCTYLQGYVKRQALYACTTCSSEEAAGICLACSYACHEGHELVELYTKRNFRCDCGNKKFPSNKCKLLEKKIPVNVDNSYNQNFFGKYCTCSRPYPDPDDNEPDEMIQCVVCEDWFHGRHLGHIPENEDYGEMICAECMKTNQFLWNYQSSNHATKIESSDEKAIVDCVNDKDMVNGNETNGSHIQKLEQSFNEISDNKNPNCLLKNSDNSKISGAAFWPDAWRNKLCECENCKELYGQKKLEFLLDSEDTVHSYEEKGKSAQNGSSQYDQGMSALGRMDRIKQVEAIHGYNDMKTALKDYLSKFASNGKVVREEDIHEFFGQMKSRKKMKTGAPPPHFCK